MNATASHERVLEIFTVPSDGTIGLVDRMLDLARGRSLRVEWRDERLWVHLPSGGAITLPFRKAVFRAALARIDVLCEQHRAGSVSPYGGMGKLSAGDPPTLFRVAFTNTPDEQSLEVIDEHALQRFLAAPDTNGKPLPPP
ncbi:MAG: hypothetical protein ACRC33_14550 [Gemmataceae bacterium]